MEGFGRGIIRDRVLRDGSAVSLTEIDVSPDLQTARVFWERAAGGARVRELQAGPPALHSPCHSPSAHTQV